MRLDKVYQKGYCLATQCYTYTPQLIVKFLAFIETCKPIRPQNLRLDFPISNYANQGRTFAAPG